MKRMLILATLFLVSCTETVPIRPVYTGDTGWVPDIYLAGNGFRRFALERRNAPSLSVERNISFYSFQLSSDGGATFTILDSVDVERTWLPYHYDSPPVLTEGNQYQARVALRYRDGTVVLSDTVRWTAAPMYGEILRTIPVPDDSNLFPEYQQQYKPWNVCFDNGYLYALQSGFVTRIDTVSGEVKVISTYVVGSAPNYSADIPFVVDNNQVYLHNDRRDGLLRFVLPEMELVGEIILQPQLQNVWYMDVFLITGDSLYLKIGYSSNLSEVVLLNAHSFEITRRDTVSSYSTPQCTYDGNNIWSLNFWNSDAYDRGIVQFDPASNGPVENTRRRIPVFDAHGLAWDGSGFWTFDPEARAFVKFRAE
jgi:hypothetical protein